MSDFLAFRKMITPVIIQVIFWILLIVCLIFAIVLIAGHQPAVGLLLLVLGPLFVRIYCEMLIVLFVMNDALQEIKKNTARGPE
jgi:hypothetical protein